MSAFSLRPRLRTYGFAALLLALAADGLFFGTLGRPVGLSAPVFLVSVAGAAVLCQLRSIDRALLTPSLLLILSVLALAETVDGTSLAAALTCLSAFVLAAARRLPSGLDALPTLGRFLLRVPLALPGDNRRRRAVALKKARRHPGSPQRIRAWLVWTMPIVLGCGFVFLLAAGNPILERWLAQLDPFILLRLMDPARILFWALVIAVVWAFLRPRLPRPGSAKTEARPVSEHETARANANASSLVCGPAAILRALGLFNGVFALQTLLDAIYLWGGAELPEGIGYAAYAHRGAYTLVATALLAAGFVLVALRPGTKAAADRRIRALVYLWIGQNVVLVLSSILRLDLYVDVYALTHWRLAAFIWMGIVATGLVLICLRIAGERSNRWLVGANMLVLAFVVAVSCFVDDDALVAGFNVDHSREISGQGVPLDVFHLASLGPAAIPSIDRFLTHSNTAAPMTFNSSTIPHIREMRARLADEHRLGLSDWRDWTFRKWRLTRYLDTHEMPVPASPMNPVLTPADGSDR